MPPPTISHTAARIKNVFEESLLVFRLAMPIIKKTTGGPNVIRKQIIIKAASPSIIRLG
jgi:hypothetical protein